MTGATEGQRSPSTLLRAVSLSNGRWSLAACPPCLSSAREQELVSARELSQAFYEGVNTDNKGL